MEIEFIKATDDDSQILGKMNKELIEDELHSNPMDVNELTERMRNFLNREYTAYLIIADNVVSGYCLFREEADNIYIRQLFVQRDKRRVGLGGSCIHWMKSNVWTDRKLRMEVLCHNKSGIEFWRRIGFKDYCITMEMQ